MIRLTGMANKKVIPIAFLFLVFNLLKMPNIHHIYEIAISDITTPIENTDFSFTKILSTYKYGIVKILKLIRLLLIPLFPHFITEINTNHAKAIELVVILDQVNWLEIA